MARGAFATTRRAVLTMMAEDGLMVAGYMSFTALLAFFPFLIFLMAVASFLGTEADVQSIVAQLLEVLPADVTAALRPVIEEVVVGRQAGFLTFGLVVALWAASSGIEALRLALNRAYGIERLRPFWLRRLQSLLFVLLLVALAVLVSVLLLLGPIIADIVSRLIELPPAAFTAWGVLRYLISTAGMAVTLLILHRFLPNRVQRLRQVYPGVVFTVLAFLVGGTAFSIYLRNFADYGVTYGSLASVVVSLIFFYLTSAIFVLGAYVNRALEEGRRHPQP